MWDSDWCSVCPSAWGNPVWFPPGFRDIQVLELAGLSEYFSRLGISSDMLTAYSALDILDLIFRTANKQSHGNQIQSCSAGFQAHEGLRSLLVDLQQNWVHKPHPEFPARGPGRCGEWGRAVRGAAWLSAGLPARYNCSTSQPSDVLHHTVHITASGLAFPCCISVKPKYLCLFSTQFILNGKDCCQHVKDICNTNVDLPNLDTGKAFWVCRAGHMPTSRISVSLLPRDTCLS